MLSVGKLQPGQVNQRKRADSRGEGSQGSAFTRKTDSRGHACQGSTSTVQILKSVFCQMPCIERRGWCCFTGACVLGQAEGKWDEDLSAGVVITWGEAAA